MKHSIAAVLAFILMAGTVQARYIRPDLVNIPVPRLIENLEELAKKNPKDVTVRFNLARVHAMAFALKTDTTQIRREKESEGAWFGYEPKPVPFAVQPTEDAARKDAAEKHLQAAIRIYEDVVKEKPDHLIAQLGFAWCIAQQGDKTKAVAAYRKVAELAWEKEKDLKVGGLGFHAITSETAGYLVPLLDKEKDKEEIARLEERAKKLNALPRPITPIAIPLRPGMRAEQMVDPTAAVRFDLDGTARPQTWTWLCKDAAWLVSDPRGTGRIDSGLQLFGNVTWWCFWENGYQALAALDDNGDGVLTGAELRGLALWHDRNGNGICDPGEVKPLAEWGIVALSCRAEKGSSPHVAAWAVDGVRFADGSVRASFDVILNRR